MIDMFWTSPEKVIYFLPDITKMRHDENDVTVWTNGQCFSWKSNGFPEDADALVERWQRVKMLATGLYSDRNYAAQDLVVDHKMPDLSGPQILRAWNEALNLVHSAEGYLTDAPKRESSGNASHAECVKTSLVSAKEQLKKAIKEIEKIIS